VLALSSSLVILRNGLALSCQSPSLQQSEPPHSHTREERRPSCFNTQGEQHAGGISAALASMDGGGEKGRALVIRAGEWSTTHTAAQQLCLFISSTRPLLVSTHSLTQPCIHNYRTDDGGRGMLMLVLPSETLPALPLLDTEEACEARMQCGEGGSLPPPLQDLLVRLGAAHCVDVMFHS